MTPFGFTPGNSDDSNEPVDFAAMMQQMQQQIQEQFSKLGINATGLGGSTEALPKNLVRDTAKKFATAQGSAPIGANDVSDVEQAISIAELWLNDATFFPQSPNSGSVALARTDWVDTTLAGWQTTVEPLAIGLSSAIGELLNQAQGEADQQDNPFGADNPFGQGNMQIPIGMISALLNSFIGSLVATQLGQAIGGLAGKVTGAHDVGLPLIDGAYPTLVPQNIKEWATDLDIPMEEIRIFHALREAAIARLFAHNPWLVSYIRTAITDYGKGINIDMEAIQEQAQQAFETGHGFDPSNPESFTIALNDGIFTPQENAGPTCSADKVRNCACSNRWLERRSCHTCCRRSTS
jgi:putative hydrolase